MTANIGYKFYKEYFNNLKINKNTGIPTLDNSSLNKRIFEYNLNDYGDYKTYLNNCIPNGNSSFDLTTVYPGLLIGAGYIHEIGSNEKDYKGEYLVKNELKLGFFFDHTTGLPIIPGSSVKGVLRDASEKADGNYILSIIKDLSGEVRPSGVKDNAKVLLNENKNYFAKDKNQKYSSFVNDIFVGADIYSYKQDVFFDACPTSSGNIRKVRIGGEDVDIYIFLSNDYITPHPDSLKNPKPIQFLKILPNVQFQFNFKIHNSTEVVGLTKELKLELFKQILLDIGIGAKTNVGYGQFC